MPKDELDPDDPMELFGVGILTDEETTTTMTECFIEEFLRLGYNHKQILALFRNRHYTAMNMVVQAKGVEFVRTCIAETFAKWGKTVTGPNINKPLAGLADHTAPESSQAGPESTPSLSEREKAGMGVCSGTDPMGAPAPDIHL
jgi:hypothetical protein